MQLRVLFVCLIMSVFFTGCRKYKPQKQITERNFKMGFSTWPPGPTTNDLNETFDFINAHSDIISIQMDDKIPWTEWISGSVLPADYIADVNDKSQRVQATGKPVVLSISPLNTDRNNLIEDWTSGNVPSNSGLNDVLIREALKDHFIFLISEFQPEYLIASMEVNDLYLADKVKYDEFRLCMEYVISEVKNQFPNIQVAQSVTLHNMYGTEVDDKDEYLAECSSLMNTDDFAAVSFYPFFSGLDKHRKFQKAFDFLHGMTTNSIAFVETCHLAEDLEISTIDLNIKSSPKEQNNYLESLLINANANNYLFVIWWAHKDYDALWEIFPENVKDIGKVWRDTGLIDENDEERKAFETWEAIFKL